MADFRNRVLNVLDNVYGFLSEKRSISRVELEHSVQLVHDVSREAELGTGAGEDQGFGIIEINQSLIAGNLDYALNIYDLLDDCTSFRLCLDSSLYRIWYMGGAAAWATTDAAGKCTSVAAQWVLPALSQRFLSSAYPGQIPFLYTDAHKDTFLQATTPTVRAQLYAPSTSFQPELRIRTPLYLPRGTQLTYRMVGTGVSAAPGVTLNVPIWFGKVGVTPPGMR